MKVRVRIAPSPTGLFHLGSLRTTLTNFLFARKERGTFIVRVEDTDQTRLVPEAIPDMLDSLRWCGIQIDEGVTGVKSTKYKVLTTNVSGNKEKYNKIKESVVQKGNFGPYIQSERLKIYQRYAEELMRKGAAYPCFCSSARLEKLRKDQQHKGLPSKYDRHCLDLSPAEARSKMAKEPHVIRLRIPASGKTFFNDLIRGRIEIENRLLDDPVLMKSDGFPTYHFAVVIDDHLMRITHIFRGEEWIPSTPKHILIYKTFGWEIPQIGHLTNILNMKGGKLSKRDGDVSVSDFRRKGYLPEAVVNFVALLGWNPKTTKEIFSLPALVKEFDVKKLNKAAPRFDLTRLEWFGAHYMKQKNVGQLARLATPYLYNFTRDEELIKKIVTVQQPRMASLSDVSKDIEFIFKLQKYPKQLLRWKDMDNQALVKSLRLSHAILEKIPAKNFNLSTLEKSLMKAAGNDRGSLLWPLRVALSGKQKSPSPFECCWMLGKPESLERIKKAIRLVA
jgi:nondiscriminating glutamyl-tRNA synthetase